MCCGQGNAQSRAGLQPRRLAVPLASAANWSNPLTVWFEYFGRTGLTVLGRISGKHYRFERPGFQVEVDGRDAGFLATLPNLRQVRRA
jgi:hypothetical protein